MRSFVALALAAAPVLAGCTVVMKGASALHEANGVHAARVPVDPETLRLGERVRVEAQERTPVVGRWAGISQTDTSRAYVLRMPDDANTVVPLSQRPVVYRLPPPSHAAAFLVAGLAMDAALLVISIREGRARGR